MLFRSEGLVRIKKRLQNKLVLGNLYAVRDWGHAKDYAVSMWKILQYKKPDDWVIATNKENTVKKFVDLTAKKLSIKIKWVGKGIKERGIDLNSGKTIIELDPKFLRPSEVDFLKFLNCHADLRLADVTPLLQNLARCSSMKVQAHHHFGNMWWSSKTDKSLCDGPLMVC